MKFNLQKNRMDFKNRNLKIIHPASSEKSYSVTDPLGKTVKETGDELITT